MRNQSCWIYCFSLIVNVSNGIIGKLLFPIKEIIMSRPTFKGETDAETQQLFRLQFFTTLVQVVHKHL